MAPTTKRRKYDANFKLNVVAFVKSSNNRAEVRKYGANEKLVRDWKKSEALEKKKMPKKKCALKTAMSHWADKRNYLQGWFSENHKNLHTVTSNSSSTQSMKWAKTSGFSGSD